jgi:hypothetical protein
MLAAIGDVQNMWHCFVTAVDVLMPFLRNETSLEKFGSVVKNAVLWDVTPCGSRKNRGFGGTYRLHHKGGKDQRSRNNVSSS